MVDEQSPGRTGLTLPSAMTVLGAVLAAVVTATFGPGFLVMSVFIASTITFVVVCVRSVVRSRAMPAIASASGLCLLAWILVFSPGAIFSVRNLNVEGFLAIRPGMRLADVEKLMGGPSGNYGANSWSDAGQTAEGFFCPAESERFQPPDGLRWTTDWHSFEVCFDDGRVVAKHERAKYGQVFSIIGRIVRLFGGN